MLRASNIEVWGFKHAIRGMRNPMNSWSKSDSIFTEDCLKIGPNDLKLMKSLYKGGSEHRKYLRQITVSLDIIAPLYWWKEFDTYKINTTSNSCSTMHKLLEQPFKVSDFSFDKIICDTIYDNTFSQDELYNETWKQIPFEEAVSEYECSNLGRVRRTFKDKGTRILGSYCTDKDRIVTIGSHKYSLNYILAYTFMCNELPKNGKFKISHIDGNVHNYRTTNIKIIPNEDTTMYANYIEKVDFNRKSTELFTLENRHAIRMAWQNFDMTLEEMALKYNTTSSHIYHIIHDTYTTNGYDINVLQKHVYDNVVLELIAALNELRDAYIIKKTNTNSKEIADAYKQIWYMIVQLLPSSYNQKRTITLNYENVINMIHQRKSHKLDEWREELVPILLNLPYISEIIEEE